MMALRHRSVNRRLVLPNIGGFLLGVAALWLIGEAAGINGGRCGPFPREVSWFGLSVFVPALWSVGDLVRGVRSRSDVSILCGLLGVVLGVVAIQYYAGVQLCRN